MSGSVYLSAAGAMLQQTKLEILSNNVANINTIGYKEDLPIFRFPEHDLNTLREEINNIPRQQIKPYTPPFDTRTDFSSGAIKFTGNNLDLALNGDGFFVVQGTEGIRYTRQGNFSLSDDGVLVTQNGEAVMGQNSEIQITGQHISIGTDGTIGVDGEIVDQLRLVRFDDMSQLKKVGNAQFKPADEHGADIEQIAENTSVNQGYIELSNVNAIRAMTGMIEALRVTQTYQKIMQASDDATSKMVNEVANL